jgi:hypothetical protein
LVPRPGKVENAANLLPVAKLGWKCFACTKNVLVAATLIFKEISINWTRRKSVKDSELLFLSLQ